MSTAPATRLFEEHDHRRRAEDGATCSLSAADGPEPRTGEQYRARPPGWRAVRGGVLDKIDQVDDEELLELVEMEVRELLSSYDFPGARFGFVKGSALVALNDGDKAIGAKGRDPRADGAVDEYSLRTSVPIDQPFLMPIEDVFSISARGTVVTGRVRAWRRQGWRGNRDRRIRPTTRTSSAPALKCSASCWDQGQAGENIGALLFAASP